jgi:hypothetical protein
LARRFLWRLGVEPRRTDADLALVAAAHQQMHDTASGPDALFFTHRGGRNLPDSEFGTLLAGYEPVQGEEDHLWKEAAPPTLLIEEVERIWAEIDSRDDWSALTGKIADIRRLGQALGEPPVPQGHSA